MHTKTIAYVSNAASTANNAPSAIGTAKFQTVWFAIRMKHDGSPVGELAFTGSIDGTNFAPLPIEESMIGGLVATTITRKAGATNIIAISSPAAAVSLLVRLNDPPLFVKVAWTRTSGGDADGLYVDYLLRAER